MSQLPLFNVSEGSITLQINKSLKCRGKSIFATSRLQEWYKLQLMVHFSFFRKYILFKSFQYKKHASNFELAYIECIQLQSCMRITQNTHLHV